jgi:hypothetical protein
MSGKRPAVGWHPTARNGGFNEQNMLHSVPLQGWYLVTFAKISGLTRPLGLFRWTIAAALLLAIGCGREEGPPRHPVAGSVLIDGKPQARVLVQLVRADDSGDAALGNDAYPSGYTDADGKFLIGKDEPQPGVVEGDYQLLFMWMSSGDLDAFDKLNGRYADRARSPHKIVVPSDGLQSLEFRLTTTGGDPKR